MANPFDLSGKVALVTGGNGGIGLGMAEAMAAAGASVAIWGTNAEKNARALDRLRAHGGEAEAFVCDVSDRAAVEASMAATLDRFGRVDGCFANAGVSGRGERSFLDITPEEWRRVLSVNLDGVYHTYQAVLRHMVARAEAGDPGGRLACVSSLASVSGAARNEHYAASKGALNAMTYALAVEFARYGITANAILPGWIATDMTETARDNAKFAQAAGARIPVRRWGEPTDFGGIAVYLMSDASAYHTGQLLQIDGGYFRF
ncbi:SDR family NAD(P)-dependent oxidoreductase [Seohaeicola zhoushanensis]|uniref:2-deoxy-D-gluconate 3-dehydrogenase n=1 Tax=Seohaeicola zhoushanensis TaxID=1569283 RepID=A0A8J3GWP3_9RHOB|nr:SDR family NAD(P)-dependent oxidoreductase [Seohaeicola zhoushanensis]GHF48845.1 2-deoxy-D-gluconate 3-dehydrogenase [Seohaeicola zhoushanensis]